uniref:Uncharacterized protein n=1 Tax=Cajanus cajan TaxID=3821 RepID=A0A151SH64_CAJCA|nr:hypothetical protein KK1_000293 [Cajanus cajan]
MRNVVTIKCSLRCFELAYGLKVNFLKSRFEAVGVHSEKLIKYANFLNCKLLPFSFTYLGIPISTNPRKVETWKPIVEKIKMKLNGWKHKLLSFVEKVCLINLVMTSLPLFFSHFLEYRWE